MQPIMLLLKKRISLPSIPSLRHLYSLSTAVHIPPSKSNFVTEYLINSCGASPEKAATASKYIRFTSPSKPDSVRHFLKHSLGLTDANICSIISRNFLILRTDVDKILEPNFRSLLKITSWSPADLQHLIISNPSILLNPKAISRLEFWKNFLNGDMKKLLLAARRNLGLFGYDVDKGTVTKKIALLKEYGFSQTDIGNILVKGYSFFKNTTSLKYVLKRLDELGFPRGSPLFMRGLLSLSNISPDRYKTKIEVYKRLGWSEAEFVDAFQKVPIIVCLSDENIREKMEFLVGTARCKHSFITSRPTLLTYSLKKRLIPRLHVMNILTSRNLLGGTGLNTFISFPESEFIARFILPNKDKVPELHDIYIAACAGKSLPLIDT